MAPSEHDSPVPPQPANDSNSWDRIASELRAHKENQRKTWGDLDNVTIGRYLAGEVGPDERGAVERALATHPELQQLTDLVRDVLGDLAPISDLPTAAPEPPVVLSFQKARETHRRSPVSIRRYAALAAAACLLFTLNRVTPDGGFFAQSGQAPAYNLDVLDKAVAMSSPTARTLFTSAAQTPSLDFHDEPAMVRGSFPERAKISPPLPSPPRLAADPPIAAVSHDTDTHSFGLASAVEAARAHREGRALVRDGKLVDAERSLNFSYSYLQKRLGQRHPYTTRAAVDLANLYAPALNEEVVTLSKVSNTTFHSANQKPLTVSVHQAPRSGVLRLREQIQSQTIPQVQANVVPVLVQALQACPHSSERQELVRALGNLGSAAAPALPALEQCLHNAANQASNNATNQPNSSAVAAAETRVVLFALGQIGPAAVPVLARAADEGKPKSVSAVATLRLSEADRKLAHATLRKLQSPEALAGVADEAGCLSFRQIRTSSMQIRRIQKDYGLTVLVETRPDGSTHQASSRLHQLGKHGVHVIIDPTKPSIEVHSCSALNDAGFSATTVLDASYKACQAKKFDDTCATVVTHIREQAAKISRR